uniref:Uncharacterized protein n=1 Tax=Tanacetum cinerariifolium TaxID=118510 RepID=A0A6L2KR20_TANCI|nr:hypothetical protein [Tanacetum cinerariifolium]
MIVAHQDDDCADEEPPLQDLPSTSQVLPTPPPSAIAQPPSPQQQPQPSHYAKISMDLFHTLLETWGIISNIDANEDVTLKDVATIAKEVEVEKDAEIEENADVQGRQAESQTQIYQIDLEHADKVLSMQDDKVEPTKLQEVVEVVTSAKLMTEVVIVASATITSATTPIITAAITTAPSAARRRKRVVIRDPKETATPSIIIHFEPKSKDKGKRILVEEPKPLKKQAQIEQDEAYARELMAELNKNINWDDVVDQVRIKEKKDNVGYTYNILVELGPESRGPRDTNKDSPEGKIGIYTRQIEFVNFHMGLLDFVKSLDPSKVKTEELTLDPNEVPLLTETADAVVNPSPQIIRLVTHTIVDEIDLYSSKNKRKVGASSISPPVKKDRTGGMSIKKPAITIARKSPAIIRKLIKQANVDSGGAASHAEEFVSCSVTPFLERECKDQSVLNDEDNVRTCPPGHYVVLSSSSTDTNNLNSPKVIPSTPFVQENIDVVATEPPGATHDSFAPVMEVGGRSFLRTRRENPLPHPGKVDTAAEVIEEFTLSANLLHVNIDDPDITMEEYIRIEEEKARRRGKVYNWETATYGKILYDEDVHDLRSVETEFPTIVFNDNLHQMKHSLVNPR